MDSRPIKGGTNVYSASDTLDLIRGKHDVRFGVTYRAEEMNIRNNAFQDGFITEVGAFSTTGDNMGDLLLGSMGAFAAHDQTFLGGTVGRRWKLFRPFVQDDWRVTNNLTLNLGVAWALATPETEVGNRQANFDVQNLTWYVPKGSPALTGCTACVTTDRRVGIQFQKTALEPRIGFAWKPMGSDKTAIRAGYAIFHDSAWNQGGQGLWQNPPYYAEVDPCHRLLPHFRRPRLRAVEWFLTGGGHSLHDAGSGWCGLQLPCNPHCLYRNQPVDEPQFRSGHGSAVQPQY